MIKRRRATINFKSPGDRRARRDEFRTKNRQVSYSGNGQRYAQWSELEHRHRLDAHFT